MPRLYPWKGLKGEERRLVLKSLCPGCNYPYDSYTHWNDCIIESYSKRGPGWSPPERVPVSEGGMGEEEG